NKKDSILILKYLLHSQTSCPYRCHCFTSVQILCSDERMISLPRNMSRQVKDFILVNSAVSYLFSPTLEESPQLTKLIFLSNALRSVHAQAFEHLTELQELEISGNPWLEHLYLGTFSKQGNLTKLLLNCNRFKTVLPGMFDSLKQLQTLQMKGNIISDLPTFLFLNLQNLRVLDLSQNKLEDVKREVFSGLARLEILRMNNNLIRNLTSNMFHNISQLIELHFEGNKISELADDIFFVLTKLKVLNLRGNLLTVFRSLTSLTDLILSSNQLSDLPEDIFRNVTALENLDLSENQLTLLPEMIFHNLSSIKAIHLNKNHLSNVNGKLLEDQLLLQQLYLSDNQLESLPQGFLDPFVMQHTVRLHGNPWKCDCRMSYLHDWMLTNSRGVEMLDRVVCASPGYLRSRAVVSIDKEQLVCPVSKDDMPDLRSCSLQAVGDTVIINCKMDTCSPLTVKVQFQEDDGSIMEHIMKHEPKCSNETMIEIPVQ
uniref:LRRCT domain-containing protein n=1 Tax=Cyclopterus lumpus TaxID=8103 RepID=A0A8C2XCY7_CYCLU